MRTIHLDGQTISTTDLCDVAYGRARAEIALDAMPKITAARQVVENILDKDLTVYGVNTGFGSLVNTRISKDDLGELQLNLIRSHACGLGPALSIPHVRAMMLARANSLAKGHSGVRFEVIEQIIASSRTSSRSSRRLFTLAGRFVVPGNLSMRFAIPPILLISRSCS